MDLFTPVVAAQRLHPNFVRISDDAEAPARRVMAAWADGFVDRDGKFVLEFQTTFNSSFWELYLFACTKELGLPVDFSYASPDFVLNGRGAGICIEATTANNAKDAANEWERDYSNPDAIDLPVIADLATIRLANAMTSKHRKYLESYAALNHVQGKPFIVAIAPFEQPFFFTQNLHGIRRVLFGYDQPIYEDFPERNERVIHGHQYMDFITKPNGSQVPLGYFTSPVMKEISAVLYSNTATYSKVLALCDDTARYLFSATRYDPDELYPIVQVVWKDEYHETLLDGLNIFYNPFATVPVPFGSFDRPDITQHTYDIQERLPVSFARKGNLIQRTVMKLITRADDDNDEEP